MELKPIAGILTTRLNLGQGVQPASKRALRATEIVFATPESSRPTFTALHRPFADFRKPAAE